MWLIFQFSLTFCKNILPNQNIKLNYFNVFQLTWNYFTNKSLMNTINFSLSTSKIIIFYNILLIII